jgi:hypothetical protein
LDEPPIDPALATIIVRWPTLPDNVKAAVVALIEEEGFPIQCLGLTVEAVMDEAQRDGEER